MDQIAYCIENSDPGYAVLLGDDPIVIFGVVPKGEGGVPWMLATDDLNRYGVTFYRESKKYMHKVRERFPYLENYVYTKNEASKRWLKWLDFKFDEPIGNFQRFYWERGDR